MDKKLTKIAQGVGGRGSKTPQGGAQFVLHATRANFSSFARFVMASRDFCTYLYNLFLNFVNFFY